MAIRWAWAILPLLATSTSVAAQDPYAAVKKGTLHQPTMMVPGVVTQATSAAIDPPPPCTPPAIRLAAAHHVMPDLLNCTYDQVQPTLVEFKFKPVRKDRPGTATIGIVVDQSPSAGAPMGDGGLQVYVAAAEPPPPPPPQPVDNKPQKTPHKTEVAVPPPPPPPPPPCSAPDDNSCILYPPWVWPSVIGFGIVLLVGLLWWLFHKPGPGPTPPEEASPEAFVVPTVRCEMKPGVPHLEAADTLAETPHLRLSVHLEPEPPRTSAISIEREELYRDR